MRNMMGVMIGGIMGVIVAFSVNPTFSTEVENDDLPGGLSLVIARPVVTREIGPVVDADKGYSFSTLFEVKLTNVTLVFGDVEKDITVNLTANHREVFKRTKLIHVLLETSDGVTRAVYWGHPYRVACVPVDVIDGRPEGSMFYLSEQQSNRERRRVCIDAETK